MGSIQYLMGILISSGYFDSFFINTTSKREKLPSFLLGSVIFSSPRIRFAQRAYYIIFEEKKFEKQRAEKSVLFLSEKIKIF